VRASNDLLLTGNSKSAREGFDRRLSTLHQSLQLHAAAWVDVKAPTEALVQQIEGFGKLPKLSPDNDDALIAYGKLSTVSDEALKALEQLVQLHGDAAAAHARRLLLVMLGGATLALTLVTLCALGVQRRLRRSLGGELEHAQALMQRVGRGDLSPIAVPPRVSPRSVIGGLAAMVDGLRGSITQVQQTASLIGSASGEIASGSQDLSHRTELNAGSLQQTASAMEELTSTVGQTADSARTAQQLAQSASSVAAARRHRRGPGGGHDERHPGQLAARSATSSARSTASPSRPTSSRSTPRSKPRVPAKPAAALPWWRPRCAAWRSAVRAPRARSRA
jgi:methyl-accepting chemotaxis protein